MDAGTTVLLRHQLKRAIRETVRSASGTSRYHGSACGSRTSETFWPGAHRPHMTSAKEKWEHRSQRSKRQVWDAT